MAKKTPNTFNEGMNLNLADMVMSQRASRLMMNMRIVDLDSSTFVVSNIRGTEERFQITNGYIPLADAQYNGILYILSINPVTSIVELGTYPSPPYEGGSNVNLYRPLNNLDLGPFRTTVFGYTQDSQLKLVLQPDYDESVNIIIIGKDHPPRIVNSKFKGTSPNLEVTPARPGNANSNTYTVASLDKETRLQIFTDKVLKIAFTGLQTGGKVKPGNYAYVFYYMTEDFNRTEVAGQSSICQVAFGSGYNNKRGGDSNEETNFKVVLALSNIDTDFKYIKVFALYSSGLDGVEQQYLEFVSPLAITGTTMQFSHTGFENLREVSQDQVDSTFYGINSANSGEQIDGFLILGGIRENQVSIQAFSDAAETINPVFSIKELPPSSMPGYADPANVYNFMGHFGDESYPYGIVFVLPGGFLSPVFPIQGKVMTALSFQGLISYADQANGIVTFPQTNKYPSWYNSLEQIKYLKMDVSAIPQEIKDVSIGFFFVRGERRPWLISQGLIIPTLRVPPIQTYDGYYYGNFKAGQESAYKLVPCIDQLIESYELDEVGSSDDPNRVIDDFFQLKDGYMPIFVNDMKDLHGPAEVDNFPINAWAFIPGDMLVNEPRLITSLQRESPWIHQLGKAQFRVKGQVVVFNQRPYDDITDGSGDDYVVPNVGLHYDMEDIETYLSPPSKQTGYLTYVTPETWNASRDFIGAHGWRLKFNGGSSERSYNTLSKFNSYFGFTTLISLTDALKLADNPQAGNARMNNGGPYSENGISDTSGVKYSNLNLLVPAGWIANVYPSQVRPSGASLYPTTDDIVYKQVTPRYTWAEADTLSNSIDVFGGDAYICKVSRKLNQSGFRRPTDAEGSPYRYANIDQGIMLTWWQESQYNLYLREPVQFDASESEKRSFFPYQSQGDFIKYRSYRYPESVKGSPGYSELLPARSFVPAPSLSPAIRNNFFSRLVASSRHIPNAFRNGYRLFQSNNFRDYDASMGEIVELIAHQNWLIIVFEHGVGAAEIEQRVLTGRDAAGPVYAEPSSVLPPKIGFPSKKIGAQRRKAVLQTPGAIYGMDEDKKKIWQFTDKFEVVSDITISSFLEQNTMANPRTGFDFRYSEAIFTTDYWTLCFKEGLNRFTAFYSFLSSYYASRANDFYSFKVPSGGTQGAFHQHDADTRLIFGEQKDAFLEFVINEDPASTKVFDLIQLVSNEVRPSKIEFFTYEKESKRLLSINAAACQQYADVLNEISIFTGQNKIAYTDKQFEVEIPKTKFYKGDLDKWGIGGRMRNKALLCRLTYNTDQAVQLMAVITTYRISKS